MSISRYWPIDTETEGQIYDLLAWDLPGLRGMRTSSWKSTDRKAGGWAATPRPE